MTRVVNFVYYNVCKKCNVQNVLTNANSNVIMLCYFLFQRHVLLQVILIHTTQERTNLGANSRDRYVLRVSLLDKP